MRCPSINYLSLMQTVNNFTAGPGRDVMRLTEEQALRFGMHKSTVLSARWRCMVVLVHYLPSFRSENSRSIGLNTTADLINLRQSVINEAYSCHPWFGDIPDEIFVLIMLEVPDEVKAWTRDTLISRLNHLLYPEESLDEVLNSFMTLKALSVRQYYERSAFVFYKRWGIDPSPSRAREIDENSGDENNNVILHVIPV